MRSGLKWALAGLVTVVVFAAVTWLFTSFVAPLWVRDGGARLGWGLGAGAAAAGLAALWGKVYATADPERRAVEASQVVENSMVGGGVTQVSGVGSLKITHRRATPLPMLASPAQPEGAPQADTSAAGGQQVSGASVTGPVDQVRGVDGEVEIEQ